MSPRGGASKPKKGNRNAAKREANEKKRVKRGPGGVPLTGPSAGATSGRGRSSGASSRGRSDGPGRGASKTDDDRRAPRRSTSSKGLGGDQVEGRQAVRELLLAGTRKVTEVYIVAEQDDNEVLADIADLARSLGVPCRELSRPKFGQLARTEAPQGVLAKAHALPEFELELLTRTPAGGPPPLLVALDGVTDPGNLGALLRSAECAGVTGIVLPRHRAVHITPTAAKAAAGAIEYLPMSVVGGLPTAITQMQKLGVTVIGMDMGGDVLFDLDPRITSGPVCLVLGAEGAGLSRLVRQRCDVIASLPLLGTLSSLNVAAAAAVSVYELARRRAAVAAEALAQSAAASGGQQAEG
jgi:23S rRNA (guanosine2251-2'-O)-methyltransferase